MTPYVELRNALYSEFEKQLKIIGFNAISKRQPGVLEKSINESYHLRATALVDRVGEGITCQFIVGLRCTDLFNSLDKETIKLIGTDVKSWPVWAENLLRSAKGGTPLDEYVESLDDIPILVKIAVKVFEEHAIK